jgi:hypothetical protein
MKEALWYCQQFSAVKKEKIKVIPKLLICDILKGLSHEIDFKNFDKNLQNLA